MQNKYTVGDEIHFKSWNQLKAQALKLSSMGYGVGVIGFENMSNNILTITELPEKEIKCKTCEYYRNPDYTRCHECKAENEDKN